MMTYSYYSAFLMPATNLTKWGIGTSDAFRELAEGHCQCDLTALFEEWVYAK